MGNIETNEIAIEEKNIDATTDNTNVNEEEAEVVDLNQENSNKDYTIFNYLKNHPASILAILTTAVTILTFFAQVMTYFANRNQLMYWGIDISYTTVTKDTLFFTAITSIIYVIVFTLLFIWFSTTSETYIEKKKFYFIYKTYEKKFNRHIKHLEQINKYNDNHNWQKQNIEIEEIKETLKKSHMEAKRSKKEDRLIFFINIIPIMLVFSIMTLIYSYMKTRNIRDALIGALMLCLLSILIYWPIFQYPFFKDKKLIKQKMLEYGPNKLFDMANIEKEYPIMSFLTKNKRKPISNYFFIAQAALILFVCISLTIFYAFFETPNNYILKDISIANIESCTYAIVYRTQDTYFMEKAEIDDNKLIIDTHEQRIMTVDDISFSVCKFDDIIKK